MTCRRAEAGHVLSLEGRSRQLWAVWGDGRSRGWALCDEKDGVLPQEVHKSLPRGLSALLPLHL